MSKRSRSASLALMSMTPFFLAACAQSEPVATASSTSSAPVAKGPTAYENVEACVFDGNTKDVCQSGFETAQAEALRSAPRFATGEECALEFDNCQVAPVVAAATPEATTTPSATAAAAAPAQAGGGSFMPLMAGFMIGQALSNSSAGAASAGFDGRRPTTGGAAAAGAGSVLYRARGGQLSQVSTLSSGRAVANPVRARTVTSTDVANTKAAQTRAAQTKADSRNVSRSGFGSRSGRSGG